MSMYEQFGTNSDLETKGVEIDYGQFRVTISRAGGLHNKKFTKTMERLSRPYRRALQTETLDNDIGMTVLKECYAEAIVLRWEVKTKDKDGKDVWKVGIEAPDGSILPFTKENVIKTFDNLHDLFMDIQEQAQKATLFRDTQLEDEAGNSASS